MSIFLKNEEKVLEQARQRCQVMRNLQQSKKTRFKQRLKTLLISKRGLSTAFVAGLVKGSKDDSTKRSKRSRLAGLARIGLTSWLG